MDETDLILRKKALRREKIALRKALAPEVRAAADSAINRQVIDLIRHSSYRSVAAYVSDGTEPDLSVAMQFALTSGKRLFLPRFVDRDHYIFVEVNDLQFPASHWGIPEPPADAPAAPLELLADSLWLVPGTAFDLHGRRLGRGGGIYDRILAQKCGKTYGIYYDVQRCPEVPVESNDRPTDAVVTELGVLDLEKDASAFADVSKQA